MLKIKNQKINGINVTVPFKKAVIPYLDKLSPEAEQTQSVNTIIFKMIIWLDIIQIFLVLIKQLKI